MGGEPMRDVSRLLRRLELGYDEQGRPQWAADQLALREQGERVQRRNRSFKNVFSAGRGLPLTATRRVHREPRHGIEIDAVKHPGRRYGPSSLKLLLPQERRATVPLSDGQRWAGYAKQGGPGAALRVKLSPRQRRRWDRKRAHRNWKGGF